MSMLNEPIHVTDAAFEQTVLKSPIPVIVDFWAPWCGPCKMVAPILDKLANEYEGKILIAKVNTDENPEWMMKYGIQGIPTMLFVKDGKIVHRQVGALPERMLRDVVAQFMEVVGQS
jgi:thioredoxin 1